MDSLPIALLFRCKSSDKTKIKSLRLVLELHHSVVAGNPTPLSRRALRECWIVRVDCLLGSPDRLLIMYDSKKNDPNNPQESYIRISNGLKPSDPKYEGALLRIRLTDNGHIVVDVLECTDGFCVGVPSRHRKPLKPVKAQTVHQYGGTYVTIDGKSVSPFVSPEFQPLIQETVTETVRSLGRQVVWEDDAFVDPELA